MNSYSLYKNIFVVLKVSPNFTDKEGEFVFGPLCPNKSYAVEIWVNRVKHVKICKVCEHEGKCLKGVDLHCEPRFLDKDEKYEEYDYEEKYDKKPKYNDYKEHDNYDDYKDEKKDYEKEEKKDCKEKYEDKKEDKYDDKREDKKDDQYDRYGKCGCDRKY